MRAPAAPRTLGRMFVTYAAIGLVPVIALGGVLAASYGAAAQSRGIAEGRSEAILIAQTAVEPVLDGRPLSDGLSASEHSDLTRLVARAVRKHDVLRLRLRDLAGDVVFSDDGSGFTGTPEDEAIDAAHGATIAELTHLNADSDDSGPIGPRSVEVYLPLEVGTPAHRVGVLEIYLPYAPISADVTADLHNLYRDLIVSLALLYLVLLVITLSVSRGLRRHAAWNAFLAEHDALTDLPNRSLFRRRTESALRESNGGHGVAVAILDLDRFKEVNDTLGHHNGDRLLIELAGRLAGGIGAGDTIARLGGDEFGVILCDSVDAERDLRRLRDLINVEAIVSELPVSIEASIGYAIAPADGTDADELLQRADIAMYVAKARHASVVRYESSQDHYDAANLSLVAELRHAIAAGDLVLHYQPKTMLSDGRVAAVEALVRWNHPGQGLLYPVRFLPLAEQTDLIFDLTSWVLGRALSDLQRLPDELCVAVNVSARSLTSTEFADEVIDALEQRGISARRLILEVTETALLTDPSRAAAILGALDARGVQVSIDDFGSGQTSLGYLSSLPIRELKIDRSFVFDMLDNPGHAAIVQSIVDLGHNLSLRVVGEGVETSSVLEGLRGVGCDEAQGYLLARPMPVEHLVPWLTTHGLPPSPGCSEPAAAAHIAEPVLASLVAEPVLAEPWVSSSTG